MLMDTVDVPISIHVVMDTVDIAHFNSFVMDTVDVCPFVVMDTVGVVEISIHVVWTR
jgi:hypothetical protein